MPGQSRERGDAHMEQPLLDPLTHFSVLKGVIEMLNRTERDGADLFAFQLM